MNPQVRISALLAGALLAGVGVAEAQQPQQQSQQDQYQGQSSPPADDVIQAAPSDQPRPKPAAGTPLAAAQPTAPAYAAQPAPIPQSEQAPIDQNAQYGQQTVTAPAGSGYQAPAQAQANSYEGQDSGTVQVATPPPEQMPQPALSVRTNNAYRNDPDGDIVHPESLPPGTLEEGAQIHVRLLTELSSSRSEKGDAFRSRVDVDVMQGGRVLIPAGSEIVGKVVEASSGRFGGHGMLRLRPETVVLPNGAQYLLVARLAQAANTRSRVDNEGTVEAGARYKRDGVEYGGGVGTGVVAGAVLGGPAGALAGGLIGAGAVTLHLMLDHPQATLEPGSSLLFTLTDRLSLVAPGAVGN